MTEQERLIVVDEIGNKIKKLELMGQKIARKNELMNNDIIKEYFNILTELDYLKKDLSNCDSVEEIINTEFLRGFNLWERYNKFSCCNHGIWMYEGSYAYFSNFYNEHGRYILVDNEDDERFTCNYYICLECGRKIKVEKLKWQEFENNNLILKNRNDIAVNKYMDLYRELLYNHTIEESQRMLIEEFNKNKVLVKKKIK